MHIADIPKINLKRITLPPVRLFRIGSSMSKKVPHDVLFSNLLLEDGGNFMLEDGGYLLLEEVQLIKKV